MPLTAEHILSLVDRLPVWDSDLDDDPNWVVPIELFGIQPLPESETFKTLSHRSKTPSETTFVLLPTFCTYSAQKSIRLDVLAHYLRSEELFDRDPWYGVDTPVVTYYGLQTWLILDGTHRILAALLKNQTVLARMFS